METEQNIPDSDQELKQNILNTVTPLSKYLAMTLFVTLPFVGFFVGYKYAPEKIVEVEKVINKEVKADEEEIGDEHDVYRNLSHERVLDRNIDLAGYNVFKNSKPELEYVFQAAEMGMSSANSEICSSLSVSKLFYICSGANAGFTNNYEYCDLEPANNYLFESCLLGGCDATRSFIDGNSTWESCYIGFGIGVGNEMACTSFPDVIENAPQYRDSDATPADMRHESCMYGVAIAKNNPDICEESGFFKSSCYLRFAEFNLNVELCEKIENSSVKQICFAKVAPLTNDVEACKKMTTVPLNNFVVHSTIDVEDAKSVNEETMYADGCLFEIIANSSDPDMNICNEISSPYYYYLCKLRVVVHEQDISKCTIKELGSQGNVDGCINNLAVDLVDISLCQLNSRPSVCEKSYNRILGIE